MYQDTQGQDFIDDFFNELQVVFELYDAVDWKNYVEMRVEELNQNNILMGEILTVMETEDETLKGSLEVVFEFLLTVKDTFPQNLLI